MKGWVNVMQNLIIKEVKISGKVSVIVGSLLDVCINDNTRIIILPTAITVIE